MKQHSLVLSEKNEKEPGNKLFEVQKRTVVLRPTDILLLLLLLFLHTLCGMADSFGTIGIAVPTAALYAAYCCRRGMRFSLFLPLCGFFASLIVTANGYRAAGSLFAGLLAFCLFSAVSGSDMRHAKTAAVVRCTAALWGYVGLLCLIFRLFNPDFSFSAAIHSAFAQTEAQTLEQLKALYDMPEFAEILSASAIPGKTVTLEALSETVHYTVLQTKYMSPAILTVFFLVLSYLTASLFKGICRLLKVTEPFGGEPFEITLPFHFSVTLSHRWVCCLRAASFIPIAAILLSFYRPALCCAA